MTNLARIQRACKFFNILILSLLISLPLLTITYWITFNAGVTEHEIGLYLEFWSSGFSSLMLRVY